MSTNSLPRLIEHLRAHAIRTDGPFTLRSGEISDWYIDARMSTFDGAGARLVGEVMLAALDQAVEAVGGMTMGADPVALATALVAVERGRSLSAFSVRKEAKQHGAGGRLVGPIRPGMTVAVVEDTVTTGGALIEAIEVAREADLEVYQALVLVDRSGSAVADRVRALQIPYRALLVPSDLGLG